MRAIKIIEGNISAGKTTLSKKLGEIYGSKVFYEPTAKNPFLEKFYKEPKKYAFRMQLWLLKYRYKSYNEALISMKKNKDEGIILDRGIFSDFVFAKLNMLEGNISQREFEIYLELREKMINTVLYPDAIIFLQVSVEECHRRIHNIRKRKEEIATGIPKSYLAGLEECYKEQLEELERKKVNIIKVDWDNFGNEDDVAKMIEKNKVVANHNQIINWKFDKASYLELQRYSVYPEWENDYKELEIIEEDD